MAAIPSVRGSVDYGPQTGLIVVDVQNDFVDPQGSLAVPGGVDVVQVANEEAARATAAGGLRVFTRDWHPLTTAHFAKDGGIWPVHCVAGTWGAAFAPGLHVGGPVIDKGVSGEDGYSGFTVRDPVTGVEERTELIGLLREGGVNTVVVVGLATDYCVKETVLDAVRLGLDAVVLVDGVRAVEREGGDGMRALDEMVRAGAAVVTA